MPGLRLATPADLPALKALAGAADAWPKGDALCAVLRFDAINPATTKNKMERCIRSELIQMIDVKKTALANGDGETVALCDQ